MLTCAGATFAGRVAGSLLKAVRLPDLTFRVPVGWDRYGERLRTAFPSERAAIDRSDYRGLEAKEATALEFAEAMVRARGAVEDRLVDRLKAHYSAKEIVEIAALVGIMELACTLAAAFGLEPD